MNEAFIQVGKMVALFGDIENLYNNVIAKYFVEDQSKRSEFFVDVMRAKHVNIEMKRNLALDIIKKNNPAIYTSINKEHTKKLISLRNIVAHSSVLGFDETGGTMTTYEGDIPESYQIVFMGAGGRKRLVSEVYEEVFGIGIPIRDHLRQCI